MKKNYSFLNGMSYAFKFIFLLIFLSGTALSVFANSVMIGATSYPSIQAAVNAASPGAVIMVGPGTYNETIYVSKSVNIQGPNAAISPNTGSRTTEAIIVAQSVASYLTPRAFVVYSNSTGVNVSIKGFKITGGEPLMDGNYTNLSAIQILFEKNFIEAGSIFYGGVPFGAVTITDNRFINIANTAVFLAGVGSATVTDNVIDQARGGGIIITASFVRGENTITQTANVLRNKISHVSLEGIQLAHTCKDAMVKDNEIDFANTSNDPNLGGIVLWDPTLFQGTKTITNNKVSNSFNGLTIYRGFDGNRVLIEGGDNITGKNITVNNNSFDATNINKAILHPGSGMLNAECNWLGAIDPLVVATRVSGNVDYTPYLINANDNSTAMGFQPVAGSCIDPATVIFCGNNNDPERKVIICQITPGVSNPEICIPIADVQKRLDAGDKLGHCPLPGTADLQNITTRISTEEVKISPNPANGGVFKVELKNFKSSTADIYIMAANGMMISKKFVQVSTGSIVQSFNLRNVPAGVYYVKVVSANGVRTSKISIKP